jgi:hypothetical protein
MGRYSRCRCRSHCRAETRAQHSSELMGRATWMRHEHDMPTASRAFPKATQIFFHGQGQCVALHGYYYFATSAPIGGVFFFIFLFSFRDGSMNNAPKKGKKRRASSCKHPQPRRCSVLPTLNNPIYPPILKQTNKQMLAVSRYVRRS